MNAYEKVLSARKSTRPMGGYYIQNMITDFTELHGDRRFKDDGAIIGGIGYLNNIPVTVIAMERGDTIQERMLRNFGCPSPEGYRKALRLMKQAEKFNRPVICFIGSPGAFCGIGAEERGQGQAIAENLMEMMTLKVPIVSVIVGEGGSGGALALGVADCVIMLENSVYSVISPEGCASIIWKDSAKASDAAECLKITAEELHALGVTEKVIEEKDKSYEQISEDLKNVIVSEIEKNKSLSLDELLTNRYRRFRKFGA
jgi:acetyl-CoA carboxylase carboxyl transferase subunit alpha